MHLNPDVSSSTYLKPSPLSSLLLYLEYPLSDVYFSSWSFILSLKNPPVPKPSCFLLYLKPFPPSRLLLYLFPETSAYILEASSLH